MSSKLYIGGYDVFFPGDIVNTGKDHSYIFYDKDGELSSKGDQKIIRGGPKENYRGKDKVEAYSSDPDVTSRNIIVELRNDARDSYDYAFSTTFDIAGQDFHLLLEGQAATDAFNTMWKFAKTLGEPMPHQNGLYETSIDYDLEGPNSNSVINTVLNVIGLDFRKNTPYADGSTTQIQTSSEYPGHMGLLDGSGDNVLIANFRDVFLKVDFTTFYKQGGNDRIVLKYDVLRMRSAELQVENNINSTGMTTIDFEGLEYKEVFFGKDSNTLKVTINSNPNPFTNDLLRVKDFFADRFDTAAEGPQTTAFEFKDLYYRVGNNKDNMLDASLILKNSLLEGIGGNDTLKGGALVDTLKGGKGHDTYIIYAGGGFDTIKDVGGQKDTLKIVGGATWNDLSFTYNGNDLGVFAYGFGATIQGQLSGNSAQVVEFAEFDNGTQILLPFSYPPVAVDDNFTTLEDRTVNGNLLADNGYGADSDPDGDVLTVTPTTIATPNGGLAVLLEDGSLIYKQRTSGFSGVDQFEYTISDGKGGTDTALVRINVTPATGSSNGGGTGGGGLPDDCRIDGDQPMNYLTAEQHAEYIGDSTLDYLLTHGYGTSDNLSGGACNNWILGGYKNDTLSGGGGNDEISGGYGSDTIYGGEGNDRLYAGFNVTFPKDLSLISKGDIIYGGPGNDHIEGWFGPDKLYGDSGDDYLIGDGIPQGGTDKLYGGAGNDTLTGGEGDQLYGGSGDDIYIFDGWDNFFTIIDTEGHNILQFSRYLNLRDLVFTQAGNDLKINVGEGDATVTIQGFYAGVPTVQTINFGSRFGFDLTSLLNSAPTAIPDSFSGYEGLTISGNVLANDSDPDGDALTTTAGFFTTVNQGQVSLSSAGDFTYTPAVGFLGTDSFVYVVDDGRDGTSTVTVTLIVNQSIQNGTTGSDLVYGLSANDVMHGFAGNDEMHGGLGNDVIHGDEGNDTLYGEEGNDTLLGGAGDDALYGGAGDDVYIFAAGGNFDTIIDSQGQNTLKLEGGLARDDLTFTRIENDLQIDTVNGVIAIQDFYLDFTTVQTITFDQDSNFDLSTVFYNNAPILNADYFSANEGQVIRGNVLANDNDPDNDTLSVSAITFTTSNGGVVSLSENGDFTYTPADDFSGEDSFSYMALDGLAGTGISNVSLTVDAVNGAPVAYADSFIGQEDENIIGNVLANDNDPDGDILVAVSEVFTSMQGGTVTLLANGNFTYEPVNNFNGTDSFNYTTSDGQGKTSVATVTLTLSSVNDAPFANNDNFAGNEGQDVVGNVLANDNDLDGGVLMADAGTFASAQGGTVVLSANGDFTYTPLTSFSGTDRFNYTALDGQGGASAAEVMVEVAATSTTTPTPDPAPTGNGGGSSSSGSGGGGAGSSGGGGGGAFSGLELGITLILALFLKKDGFFQRRSLRPLMQ